MTVQRRQFTQEFKDSAVKLITEQGYKVSEAARNLDIGVSVLRRWKTEAEAAQQDNGGTADLKAELSRLKKENHRLKLEREILKKSGGLLRKRVGERYQLIDAEKKVYPVSLMCEVLDVCRSGYYAWQRRQPSARQQAYDKLIPIVKQAHKDSKGTYGARRMAIEIDKSGTQRCLTNKGLFETMQNRTL